MEILLANHGFQNSRLGSICEGKMKKIFYVVVGTATEAFLSAPARSGLSK
jgi:hypothetical protein